jgi:5,10-methylenetetrahydromethanopterin reductase
MTGIRFGTAWNVYDHRAYIDLVRASEGAGFDLIGMGDSQSVCLDVYALLTLAAEHTDRVLLGPMVTNPVTRHPAVTACALATLQQVAGGRAFFAISGGHSSVGAIGAAPATAKDVVAYGVAARAMTAGEVVDWNGTAIRLEWETTRVPLYMTPEGPRGLHLAGQVADGVFLNTGVSADVVEDSIRRIHAGARAAGRDPEEVDIWLSVRGFAIAPSRDDAVPSLVHSLAHTINHAFNFSLDGKLVPDGMRAGIAALRREYRLDADGTPEGAGQNAGLVEKHGLLEWAMDRFAIAGPAGFCVERLRELAGLGIRSFFLPQRGPLGREEWLDVMGHEVLPGVRA